MKSQQRAVIRRKQGTVLQAKVQEAIKLLGMSRQDLVTFVKTELTENPFLTESEFDSISLETISPEDREDSKSDVYQDVISGENLVENNNDYRQESNSEGALNSSSAENDFDWVDKLAARPESLFERLQKQIAQVKFSNEERLVAIHLAENTDDSGYLRANLNDIAKDCNVSIGKVESVLSTCQKFEPTGVMARSLQECFKLQLEELNQYDRRMALVLDNLPLVASQNWDSLQTLTGLKESEIRVAITILRQLSYKPVETNPEIVTSDLIPDVIVEMRQDGTFSVELNPEAFPHVLVDSDYISEVNSKTTDDNLNQYIAKHSSRANWLIDALSRRATTILRVATEVIHHQTPFLRHGLREFQTLTARLVADRLTLHESTISRAIADKFIATPRGTFPFNFFFSRASLQSRSETGKSSESVQEQIKILIKEERPDGILSDSQIAKKLTELGVKISRRTVTKYREKIGLPSSTERRQLVRTNLPH